MHNRCGELDLKSYTIEGMKRIRLRGMRFSSVPNKYAKKRRFSCKRVFTIEKSFMKMFLLWKKYHAFEMHKREIIFLEGDDYPTFNI